MRVWVAVTASAALFGLVAVAERSADIVVELAAPAPAETVAAQLPDGTPVYLVGDEAGGVVVLSPVSTHLDHLVVWCPQARAFVEPIGASVFDERGRWAGGPAPTGLARYEARVVEERGVVRIGELQDPQPRWERPDRRPVDPGVCLVTEGAQDGVEVTLPSAVSLGDLDGSIGRRVVVQGRLHVDGQDGAWLCPEAVEACPGQEVEVTSAWWSPWLDGFEGWADGRFMVRADGRRRVSELLRARDYEDQAYWQQLEAVPADARFAEVSGTLTGVDAARGELTVAGVEPDGAAARHPPAGPDGKLTLRLGYEPWPPSLVDDRPPHDMGMMMHVLSPTELEAVVREEGPLPAELTLDGDGLVVSVWLREDAL